MMIAPPFWSTPAAGGAIGTVLVYFNGADNSTTFVDSGPHGIALSAVGNAKISTADSIDGISCGVFDGSGDRVQSGAESVLRITGDYTLEGWTRLNTGTSGLLCAIQHTSPSTQVLQLAVSGAGYLVANSLGMTSTTMIADNTWRHVAVSRKTMGPSSHFYRLFVEGAMEVEIESLVLGPAHVADPTMYFGGDGSTSVINGKLDQWRLIIGQAIYTADFTPPTPPLS